MLFALCACPLRVQLQLQTFEPDRSSLDDFYASDTGDDATGGSHAAAAYDSDALQSDADGLTLLNDSELEDVRHSDEEDPLHLVSNGTPSSRQDPLSSRARQRSLEETPVERRMRQAKAKEARRIRAEQEQHQHQQMAQWKQQQQVAQARAAAAAKEQQAADARAAAAAAVAAAEAAKAASVAPPPASAAAAFPSPSPAASSAARSPEPSESPLSGDPDSIDEDALLAELAALPE